MNTIRAIPATLDMTTYRSTLEALWALFFDTLGESFLYEYKTFQLTPRLAYCPDFWLPRSRWWVEVKPSYPTTQEQEKLVLLSLRTQRPGVFVVGFPTTKTFREVDGSAYLECVNVQCYSDRGIPLAGPSGTFRLATILHLLSPIYTPRDYADVRERLATAVQHVHRTYQGVRQGESWASMQTIMAGLSRKFPGLET